ncbi:MAG: tyrosine-type recombinase/integrase [Vicinamibacteria bacterium]|nr:tyrosine-type recombinase/integrase [Vicinamibacteria bacterium]
MGRRNLGGVFLRGKTWWIHYSRNGVLQRESSGSTSRDDAVRLLATRQAETPLVVTPRGPIGFEALFDLLAAEYDLAGRRSAGRVKQARKRLATAFGGERAEDITSERIAGYAQARRQEGAAAATVRYELAVLRRALRVGALRGRIRVVPAFPSIAVDNAREGFFEDDEIALVLGHLDADVRPVIAFLNWVPWRLREALSLEWRQVDRAAAHITLPARKVKTARARVLPYGAFPALRDLIENQWARTKAVEGRIVPWVFHREGRRLEPFYSAWRAACEAAGVPGRYIHDLRRTAARRLLRAGVPEHTVMGLGGWRTRSMLDRYAIIATGDLEEGLARLAERPTVKDAVKELRRARVLPGPSRRKP